MLFFASFSGGLLALMLAFVVLITGVGLYSVLIWPLTFWDLANLGLEKYASWTGTITASVFAGGAFAGSRCLRAVRLPDIGSSAVSRISASRNFASNGCLRVLPGKRAHPSRRFRLGIRNGRTSSHVT
jgi:hypothetical protein